MLSNGMRNMPSEAKANILGVDGLILPFRDAS
jgi:hypothetical protein